MGYEVIQIKTRSGNAYLLKGERVALVDSLMGVNFRKLLRSLRRSGVNPGDIDFILVTHHHVDHCGNLGRLKKLSGASVIAGAEDASVIEGTEPAPPPGELNRIGKVLGKLPRGLVERCQSYERVPVERKVSGGDVIEELGLEVVDVPGHTRGGKAYLDRQARSAFIGDMVSNYAVKWNMPALSFSYSIAEIFESQERLASLDIQTAYPGHGQVITPDASRRISEFVKRKKRRRVY